MPCCVWCLPGCLRVRSCIPLPFDSATWAVDLTCLLCLLCSEYIAVSAKMCIRKPDHLSHIECAGKPLLSHSLSFPSVSSFLILTISDGWSRMARIGIPENFLTAFQALFMIGNMKKGDSVLIHAGAGGVGVAANQLARLFGAKNVFTTAGSGTYSLLLASS
jgi:Zn-dependent alcohol dehydrogenase